MRRVRQFIVNLPIKRKLLFVTLSTCGAALAVACSVLFWFQSVNFRRSFVAELEALGSVIAQNSAAPLAFDDKKSAVEVLSALKVKPHITEATVFDPRGAPFARFGREPESGGAPAPPSRGNVVFHQGYAHLSLPIAMQDAASGRLLIRARFQDQYRELLWLYGKVLTVVLLGSLLIILIVTSALQHIITGPIAALATVARKVCEKEDYIARVPVASHDEVGLLTRTFNQMLDQIQSRDRGLRESQQRYEAAVQGSRDGIWDWDLTTNKAYFSPRWKEILGYEDHEIPNFPEEWEVRLHAEDAERVHRELQRYLEQRTPTYEVEYRMRHKSGHYCWLLARGAALRDAGGKALRMAGSHTDITRRKQSEIELQVSREKFEALVDSINGVVWESDLKTTAFTFVSAQSERLLGYPRRQWLESPSFWVSHIHPDDREAAIRQCTAAVARGETLNCEYRMVAADGRSVWIRDIASVADNPGGPQLLRGVLFDISEQKRAEQEMDLLNQKLRDASRAAGMAEVATSVLHNVGNVLNSVNISSGLIVDRLGKSKTASLARAVQMLRDHRDDLGEFLTGDPKGKQLPLFLEALSEQLDREQAALLKETQGLQQNIEHIKQIVAMQQACATVSGTRENQLPHELVNDALRMTSLGLSRHHIEVLREFDPVPPVLVDRHKVLQILVNLITNAKQALEGRPAGRRLVLNIRRAEGDRIRVQVTDNGIGIARENLTRIFHHGFTTKKTGHGFGLHSGANAAKEMGGALGVHSAGPGTGATFILELPVNKHARDAAESAALV